jgi:hypothetical protein
MMGKTSDMESVGYNYAGLLDGGGDDTLGWKSLYLCDSCGLGQEILIGYHTPSCVPRILKKLDLAVANARVIVCQTHWMVQII